MLGWSGVREHFCLWAIEDKSRFMLLEKFLKKLKRVLRESVASLDCRPCRISCQSRSDRVPSITQSLGWSVHFRGNATTFRVRFRLALRCLRQLQHWHTLGRERSLFVSNAQIQNRAQYIRSSGQSVVICFSAHVCK